MVTESERLEMHLGLRRELGDDLGDLLMEHLPPTGWGDVARVQDVLALKQDVLDVKQDLLIVKQDVLALKQDVLVLQKDVDRLDRKINWVITLGVTVSLGLFALQAQILLAISRL